MKEQQTVCGRGRRPSSKYDMEDCWGDFWRVRQSSMPLFEEDFLPMPRIIKKMSSALFKQLNKALSYLKSLFLVIVLFYQRA